VLVRTIVVKAIFVAIIALFASDDFVEAAARRISSLPKTMIGAWGDVAQSCGILNDIGRVIVKAGSVDFFASSHTVKSITTRPDRTIHAVTEASEEGEEGILRSTLDLKLHSPDRLSFAIDGTNESIKIRCKITAESYSKAIKPIIPHRKLGDEVCFSGTFSGQTVDMEDWANTTTEPVPDLLVGGKPATRPVPAALPNQDVSRIDLHLRYHARKENGAFDLAFIVKADSKSLNKDLFARSGCTWSGWDGEKEIVPPYKLSCGNDCKGGGMTVERIAGTGGVDLTFDYMRMSAGCGGGGRYRVGAGDEPEKTAFRLERVPLAMCRPLKAWGRKQ